MKISWNHKKGICQIVSKKISFPLSRHIRMVRLHQRPNQHIAELRNSNSAQWSILWRFIFWKWPMHRNHTRVETSIFIYSKKESSKFERHTIKKEKKQYKHLQKIPSCASSWKIVTSLSELKEWQERKQNYHPTLWKSVHPLRIQSHQVTSLCPYNSYSYFFGTLISSPQNFICQKLWPMTKVLWLPHVIIEQIYSHLLEVPILSFLLPTRRAQAVAHNYQKLTVMYLYSTSSSQQVDCMTQIVRSSSCKKSSQVATWHYHRPIYVS